jgi:membrane-associated protease RseP (regulator of RpoE activity)
MGALAVVVLAVGLIVIIMIHELGHYLTARRYGFKVEEYFLGFGPKLWSTRRGEIEYGVKAIPAGGYVKIAGMNPFEQVPPEDLPRAYGSKPIWQRALVIFAGPATHFLVAALLFATVFAVWGDVGADLATETPVVGTVSPTVAGEPSPAAEAGLQPGDTIVAVGSVENPVWSELVEVTASNPGVAVPFTIERDGRTLEVTITPATVTEGGTEIGRIGISPATPQMSIPQALVAGVAQVGISIKESFLQIGQVFGPEGIARTFSRLVTDEPREPTDPTSVVGIGQVAAATGNQGEWGLLLYMLAFVTVFIGLINLVPLPPFDGGHLMVLAIEKVRGKAVDMRRLIPVSAVVMAFFIAFVVATVINDVTDPIRLR